MADDVTVDEEAEVAQDAAEEKEVIGQHVEVSDAGPCKKHVKVTIPRAEVDKFFDKEFTGLVRTAAVPGFRPGKTPRKLIERRFKKDVASQVKVSLLMKSLEQIDEDEKVQPLTEPDINFNAITLPDDGEFTYEFDVEVRPEFDLPQYKGLKIKRPVQDIGEKEIDAGLQTFLKRFGTMETKEGSIERGDNIQADVRFMNGKDVIRQFEDLEVQVDDDLFFKDGRIEKFAAGMKGAKSGDTRELKAILSDGATREDLRGKSIEAVFVIKDVRRQILPEVDEAFLGRIGLGDLAELRDFIKAGLEGRLENMQQQAASEQIAEGLITGANWELPQDMLRKQSESTLRRAVVQLQSSGYSDDEIRTRINQLRQNSLASTAKTLKQQFVLQRIAEEEEIKVEQEDLDREVRALADRSGEPLRRVRARIDKEGLWDSIALHALERKTIDRILTYATIEDEAYEAPELRSSSGLDESAVPDAEPTPESDDSASEG